MSAIDTLRDALFGNPPAPDKEPSREGMLAAFTELYTQAVVALYATQAGFTTVATTAARDTFYAVPENRGKLIYVNNNNGSATDPANGVYEYVGSAARFAQGFYAGVAGVVQPLVDAAAASATAAGGYATTAQGAAADAQAVVRSSGTYNLPAGIDPDNGTTTAPAQVYILNDVATVERKTTQVRYQNPSASAKTIPVYRYTLISGTWTRTFAGSFTSSATAGLQTIAFVTTVAPGEWLAIDPPTGALRYRSGSVTKGAYTLPSGSTGGAQGAVLANDYQITFDYTFAAVSGDAFLQEQADMAIAKPAAVAAFGALGAATGLIAQPAPSADGIQPLIVDRSYGMLLGVRISTGEPVGLMIDQLGASKVQGGGTTIPLAAADVPVRAAWTGIVVTGESLSAGAYSRPILSTSQPYSSLTFGSGPKSSRAGNTHSGLNTSPGTSTAIPLIEVLNSTTALDTEGETVCSGMANGLVEYGARLGHAPATSIWFSSCAGLSGARLDQINKTSTWWPQFTEHVTDQKALATAASKTYSLPFVPLIIGINDMSSNTSYATYLSRLLAYVGDVDTEARGITGQSSPVHTLMTQQCAGDPVAQAQFDAIGQHRLLHYVTPTFFLPTYSDHVHLTNVGTRWLAAFFARAGSQLIDEQRQPDCLWPIAAWSVGNKAFLKFRVPRKPMVLDVTNLGATTDYGQAIVDDTGTLTLSGATIIDGDTLQFTLNRALGANPRWRCGMDYLGAGYVNWSYPGKSRRSHNLRDSTLDTITISGNARPLFHVAPHFEIPLSVVQA